MQRFFYRWRDDGLWRKVNDDLRLRVREASGREACSSAGVVDSQSVKTTEAGGPRGYDAGKKINGRKRHVLTDTLGCRSSWFIPPTSRIATARRWSAPAPAFSNPNCVMTLPTAAIAAPSWPPPSTRLADGRSRSSSATRQPALWFCLGAGWSSAPFAWLNRYLSPAKDFEASLESALAWLYLASVKLVLRRSGRLQHAQIVF